MKQLLSLLLITLYFCSCYDFFEKDISQSSIKIVSPVNGAAVEEGEIPFLWEQVNHSSAYRITIVSPSFREASLLIADSILYQDSTSLGTIFRIHMKQGNYQWNIRAMNSGYQSLDQIFDLNILAIEEKDDDK